MGKISADISTNGGSTILMFGVMAFFATVVNVLRFWARRINGVSPGLDDYLSLSLLLLVYGLLALTIFSVALGGLGVGGIAGSSDEDIARRTSNLFNCFYAFYFVYGTAATLAKLCVLALYRRIFPTVFMRRCCIALGLSSLLCGGALVIVNVVQCTPWLSSASRTAGDCVDVALFNTVMSVPDAVIDALVLYLPIRELARLQITCAKKCLLCGVFMMGALAVVASVARVYANLNWYIQGPRRNSFASTQALIGPWAASLVQVGCAAIAACLPTLPPVWHRLRRTKLRPGPSTGASSSSSSLRQDGRWPEARAGRLTPCSVLTIGHIASRNTRGTRERTAADSDFFELHRTTTTDGLCRMDSPDPASPHSPKDLVQNVDRSKGSGRHKEKSVQISTRELEE